MSEDLDLEFLLRRSVELKAKEKAPTVEDFDRQCEELYCSGKEGTVDIGTRRVGKRLL